MTKVFLDETMRTPGVDHLVEYRNSCFYPLLTKTVKERGNAYEVLAVKILKAHGYDATINPAPHGKYDIIVDGEKVELKASRKGSPYDTRGRKAQFSYLQEEGYDYIILMMINPDDTVAMYKAYWDDLITYARPQNGAWNIAKHPEQMGYTPFLTCEVA